MPPPPPMFGGQHMIGDGLKTIRRPTQTVYKLPTLNWVPLKPNQVKGTIFNELDDDKLHKTINFNEFEEKFKLGGGITNGHSTTDGIGTIIKKPEKQSLLETTRLRNLGNVNLCMKSFYRKKFLIPNFYFYFYSNLTSKTRQTN